MVKTMEGIKTAAAVYEGLPETTHTIWNSVLAAGWPVRGKTPKEQALKARLSILPCITGSGSSPITSMIVAGRSTCSVRSATMPARTRPG